MRMEETVFEKDTEETPARLWRRRDVFLVLFLLFLIAVVGTWSYANSLVYKVCRVEAGVEVSASDFIKKGDPQAVFTEDSPPFDSSLPGWYSVRVKSGLFTHRARLIVEDNVPPYARVRTLTLLPGQRCEPEDFFEVLSDATDLDVAFVNPPDFDRLGVQSISLTVTDMGGNTVIAQTQLLISAVVRALTVEAGSSPPTAEDYLVEGHNVQLLTELSAAELRHVGEYPILLSVDGVEYGSILRVRDTVPPQAQLRGVTGYLYAPQSAEAFVASVQDFTDVTAAFLEEPDLTLPGTQLLHLVLTDEGGNRFTGEVSLTLYEDTQPPEISGVKELTVLVGESVSYRKGLRLTDNCPDGLRLDIDSSGVDLNTEGVYQAICTATDLAGNSTSATITVTVLPWEQSEEKLNLLADAVLSQILRDGMSNWDKAYAIYDYVCSNIQYQYRHTLSGNWSQAAYEGLAYHRGECYVYTCTVKLLMTRAGFDCMEINRTNHYWNLVDIGDGWYHVDCTPMPDEPQIFMWTSDHLKRYSDAHDGTHRYNASLYPEIC